MPKTKYKLKGDCAFAAAAPKLWNVLPLHIRQAASLPVFKSLLIRPSSMLWPSKTEMKFVSGYIDGIGSLCGVLRFLYLNCMRRVSLCI